MTSRRSVTLAALLLLGSLFGGRCSGASSRDMLADNDPVTPQVANGTLALEGQFSFMAVLHGKGPSWQLNHFCGGTLVHPWVVMTAAHCVVQGKVTVPPAFVRIGMIDSLDKTIERTVTKVYPHPGYNARTVANDVALLLLNKPVREVPVAQLAPKSTRLTDGQKLVVAGFGETEDFYVSRRLRFSVVDYIPLNKCKRFHGWIHPKSECAGGSGTSDACLGDSGGPLLTSDNPRVQVGIVSWGQRGCGERRGRFGVYTKVASVSNWVRRTNRKAARRGRRLRRSRNG